MIVGLMGPAGSGKDTVADHLVEKYGFVRVGLADEIKRTAKRWWGFTDQQLWGPSEFRNAPDERYPIKCRDCAGGGEGLVRELACGTCGGEGFTFLTPRHALQQLGSELSRSVDPDVWVRFMLTTARELLEPCTTKPCCGYDKTEGLIPIDSLVPNKGVVVPDCRFLNELEGIKGASGIRGLMIRINRDEAGLQGKAASHASEAEQTGIADVKFSYILDNTTTLDELDTRVDRMMSAFAG